MWYLRVRTRRSRPPHGIDQQPHHRGPRSGNHPGKPVVAYTVGEIPIGDTYAMSSAATDHRQDVTVTFAGSGDAFGSGGRCQSCIVVRAGELPLILMDCVATSLVALKRQGADPNTVAAVIVSHLHVDHYSGLPLAPGAPRNRSSLHSRGGVPRVLHSASPVRCEGHRPPTRHWPHRDRTCARAGRRGRSWHAANPRRVIRITRLPRRLPLLSVGHDQRTFAGSTGWYGFDE
jgi:Metallo-beta-lactamase superfamily